MKTIVNPNNLIKNLIGEQMPKDTEYRPLKYILDVEVEEGVLLDNVITGQIVFLSREEKRVLDQLPMKPNENEIMEYLVSAYYLVPVGFDEYKFVQGYRSILQQIERNRKRPITKYTLFPTTHCNARCFYCFESGFKKTSMDEVTAKKVAEFIRQNVGGKQAELSWFGGEPTVAIKCIDYICGLLKEYGVDYVSGMVSNGYLFSKKVAEKAVRDWNLKSIQITLDGTEEVYNKTKSYNVSESAYKRVLNNIYHMLDVGIRVTVLLNLDYHNSDDLFNLVDELATRFKQYNNFRVSSHVLFNNEGYEKVHHTCDQEEELTELNYKLAAHMAKIGLNGSVMGDVRAKKKLPVLRYAHCMANDTGAIVIAPNGKFFKCEHIEDDLASAAGIDTGGFSKAELDEWFVADEGERCSDCNLYPDCFTPKKCIDHATCYPVDSDSKIVGYKENIKDLYRATTQREEMEKEETGKLPNDSAGL